MILQVTLDRANRKKDKSVSLTFITDSEQTSEEFMEVDKKLNQHGILYFKDGGNLTQQEKDEIDNVEIEVEGKTKSQRLRGTLFVMWTQQGKQGEFTQFYSSYMERVIENIKSKLD
jgi:hypothetical protein